MQAAIVSGATGFIGSSFVELLTQNNIQTLALGRKPFDSLADHVKARIAAATYLEVDMRDIGNVPAMANELQWHPVGDCLFFNLAWGGVNSLSDLDIEAQLNNVDWSVGALEVASRLGCIRFVQVGTMEEAFTHKYLALDHNVNSEFNRHVIYSVAKIAAKNSLKIKADLLNIEFIYLLHSHVMGPHDNKDSFLQVTLQKLIKSEELIFSSGEQIFDVISVEDCVEGYFLACTKGKPGSEYWVGSGNPRSLREYVERMYALYPSGKELQFGALPYNDVVLEKSVFSIESLVKDTGFKPKFSYEATVEILHDHLINRHEI